MTDKTMIELMRNAMFAEAKKHGLSLTGPLLTEDPLVLLARTALQAMREPSLAAAVAGFETMRALGLDECEGRDASRVWLAMIDAALKEQP